VTKAPKNVVASVLARLRNVAQEASLSFNDILQSYVIERFLSRLSRSPHADTVLLKGALMLRVWGRGYRFAASRRCRSGNPRATRRTVRGNQ
jgi:hypothetical protein